MLTYCVNIVFVNASLDSNSFFKSWTDLKKYIVEYRIIVFLIKRQRFRLNGEEESCYLIHFVPPILNYWQQNCARTSYRRFLAWQDPLTWRESFKSEDEAETVNQKQSIKARWNLKPDGMSEFFNLDKKYDALRPVMINTCFYLVLVSRSNRVRAFDCKVRSLRVQSQLFPIGFLGYKFAWKNWDLKLFTVRRHCTKIEKLCLRCCLRIEIAVF